MKPISVKMLPGIAGGWTTALMLVLDTAAALAIEPAPATFDGLSKAEGIRQWIEISEPGNLGLLLMGIAGLLIGRWAAGRRRKEPPRD